jgi:hypothetical protein
MYSIVGFIQVLFGVVFLNIVIGKLNNFASHLKAIDDYRIVPTKLIVLAGVIELIIQAMISISFVIGLQVSFTLLLCIGLISVYTLAIVYNLLRGRKDLGCGCGGILGDHIISWKLVLRNLLFILTLYWLFSTEIVFELSIDTIPIVFAVLGVYLLVLLSQQVNKQMKSDF